MSLLLPLGLLGLLSLIVLILIYIIKPNYQQKFISSTYVWKLSLKYRKKKIPINRLKNIILFICQVLILITCAFLLARPVVPTEKVQLATERIAIIDASASMMVKNDEATRFERAVEEVKNYAEKTADENGVLSVILASDEAKFVVQRVPASRLDEINAELDKLIEPDSFGCTYASADIEAAVELSEVVLNENPEAEVKFFTATEYINSGKIDVVNITDQSEWNAAILGCSAALVENYYEFTVEAGCFVVSGENKELNLVCEVYNYNGGIANMKLEKSVRFDSSENKQTVVFSRDDITSGGNEGIYSFEYVRAYIKDAGDSFDYDNTFFLYGGNKPVIKVQYVSSDPNKFVRNAIQTLRESYKADWNIEFTEVRKGSAGATEGFDMYIYEHDTVPARLPSDGFVMLIDPASVPEGIGFRVGNENDAETSVNLSSGAPHRLTENISVGDITVWKYRSIMQVEEGFDELMYVAGSPVMLARNTAEQKILVLAFNLHYSNLVLRIDFPRLFNNIFNYYMPQTFNGNSYEVGETVTFNARGISLNLKGPTITDVNGIQFLEFPSQFKVTEPGTYTVTQITLRGEGITEQFYVGVANTESDITKRVDALPPLNIERKAEQEDMDLLIYIAAALVALLFVEWWLQSREYF